MLVLSHFMLLFSYKCSALNCFALIRFELSKYLDINFFNYSSKLKTHAESTPVAPQMYTNVEHWHASKVQRSQEPCTEVCILLCQYTKRYSIFCFQCCHASKKANSTPEIIGPKGMKWTTGTSCPPWTVGWNMIQQGDSEFAFFNLHLHCVNAYCCVCCYSKKTWCSNILKVQIERGQSRWEQRIYKKGEAGSEKAVA